MNKLKNLDSLLESPDTEAAVIQLDTFVSRCCDFGEDMAALTKAQRVFYCNCILEREVNNGGFSQYFVNEGGNLAGETLESLKAVGATQTAAILQQAIDRFPDGTAPKDRDTRIDLVDQLEAGGEDVWGDLDEAFYEYPEDLTALNLAFVKEHREQF